MYRTGLSGGDYIAKNGGDPGHSQRPTMMRNQAMASRICLEDGWPNFSHLNEAFRKLLFGEISETSHDF
jgi:hypothetical protein